MKIGTFLLVLKMHMKKKTKAQAFVFCIACISKYDNQKKNLLWIVDSNTLAHSFSGGIASNTSAGNYDIFSLISFSFFFSFNFF